MHGNVMEWCQDSGRNGTTRACRGGSYFNIPPFLRASVRNYLCPSFRDDYHVGFRAVCEILTLE